MARRTDRTLPFDLTLEPTTGQPLHVQLREGLRSAILSRRLAPGLRLPASRLLAADCGCARGTVLAAIEQLVAEGYLDTAPGAGTFVAANLPEASLEAAGHAARGAPVASPRPPRLSRRAAARNTRPATTPPPPHRAPDAFVTNRPAIDVFPFGLWSRLMEAEWREPRRIALPAEPFGDRGLREAVAGYLGAARGFACDPDGILITQSLTQGFALIARLLLDPGEQAWVEEPGFWGIREAILAADGVPIPVPVDGEGLDIALARRLAPGARLAMLTPAHQYPLGAVMSLPRRLAVLAWAQDAGAWIVEDDYDSEYRYAGRPLAPLRALDTTGCVIYAGSFSKVLFPGLRLGYLVLPPALIEPAERLILAAGGMAAVPGQVALARFITEGHFAAHLRRTRRLYAERQAVLLAAAGRWFGDHLTLRPDDAGMHLTARPGPAWQGAFDDRALTGRAAAAGIAVAPLSRHYAEPASATGGLMLGYAAVPTAKIEPAIRRLAKAIL